MERVEVMHQKISLPLFHVKYDVVIGDSMQECTSLLDNMYQGCGIATMANEGSAGYTALIDHPVFGLQVVACFNLSCEGAPTIERTMIHEVTHLVWYIMDAIGLKVDVHNHEAQAYLMEEVHEQVSEMMTKFKLQYGDVTE